MNITKAAIEERKLDLLKQADRLKADLNAAVGAFQDCEYWLARLEQPEKAAPALSPVSKAT